MMQRVLLRGSSSQLFLFLSFLLPIAFFASLDIFLIKNFKRLLQTCKQNYFINKKMKKKWRR